MTRRLLIALVMLIFPVSSNAALTGDFDDDGEVGFADFIAFALHYGSRTGDEQYNVLFDLDKDGEVGFADFLHFSAVYGTHPQDLRENPTYMDQQIKHISDVDVFAAMDLERIGLEAVKQAVSDRDYVAAYRARGHVWVGWFGVARELSCCMLCQSGVWGRPLYDGEVACPFRLNSQVQLS